MKRIFIALFCAVILFGSLWGFRQYKALFASNINPGISGYVYVTIPTGSAFSDLVRILKDRDILIDLDAFQWISELRNLPSHINPGRYRIDSGMSNYRLINLLRSGDQEPVQVILHSTRTREMLASMVSRYLEADSIALVTLLYADEMLSRYGLNSDTWMTVIVPNTYEFYWNTSAGQFMERMVREHQKFWNDERLARAKKLNMTPIEVSILASIVQQETVKEEEQAEIAGVYLNRLRLGMKLDADPTLIFALGDFTITRVLNEHKEIDSPYNTYKYAGLPPGPICIPAISNIDAVLADKRHKYLYFCAKEDFSGYHNFARTLAQHRVNAEKFRRELNRRKIWN